MRMHASAFPTNLRNLLFKSKQICNFFHKRDTYLLDIAKSEATNQSLLFIVRLSVVRPEKKSRFQKQKLPAKSKPRRARLFVDHLKGSPTIPQICVPILSTRRDTSSYECFACRYSKEITCKSQLGYICKFPHFSL
jgi:hypothetical protein